MFTLALFGRPIIDIPGIMREGQAAMNDAMQKVYLAGFKDGAIAAAVGLIVLYLLIQKRKE